MRWPFELKIDAVEQRLGVKLCGLLPLADRFHDCGTHERQAPETLDVALGNTFVPRDLSGPDSCARSLERFASYVMPAFATE